MKREDIDVLELALSVPSLPYTVSVGDARRIFEEQKIYNYLVVVREGKAVGIVDRGRIFRLRNKNLTVGEVVSIVPRVKSFRTNAHKLVGIFEVLPIERQPAIITDKRGAYLGVLTYDVVLYYLAKNRVYQMPVAQQIATCFGKEKYFVSFGIKGIRRFRDIFGVQKQESLHKVLLEDIQDIFGKEASYIPESGEFWIVLESPPDKEAIRELFREFHKEYVLLFGEFQELSLYGFCIDLSRIESHNEFQERIKELNKRVAKIEGYVFIFKGLQPTLVLFDPSKQKIISNIKKRILEDFEEIVEKLRMSPKDSWEYVLYDMFDEYPYFELFYVISERGLQITNNVVNPKIDYFVAQGRKGTDRSDRAYFRRSLEEGTYISDIYLSQATDDFCLTVARRFQQGDKNYILAGDINFKQIHKLIKGYKESTA
jgi:CBS domain-containing protein